MERSQPTYKDLKQPRPGVLEGAPLASSQPTYKDLKHDREEEDAL